MILNSIIEKDTIKSVTQDEFIWLNEGMNVIFILVWLKFHIETEIQET